LNRPRAIPDNFVEANGLIQGTGDAGARNHSPAPWSRRALVGLFVLAFVLTTVGLLARWDRLMLQLSAPPVSTPASEAGR
jgi:hypothetical protein